MFKLNEFFKIVNMLFCTIYEYVAMFFWGIKHGKCRFWGRTFFQRYNGSSIIIGSDCEFRSNHRSNQIGVYSPCMISTLKEDASIVIGDHCGMSGCVIGCAHSIVIGNNVRIGANTLITDTDWHSSDDRAGNDKPIIIEDNVWLGYGVKVLKGVTIGENSLIGLGSIVTHDIPSNSIAVGNPCKVIRKI